MSSEGQRRTPTQERARQSRRRLVDALAQLLEDHDVDEVTVGAVAKGADLTTGAFYRHFRDLGELLDELAEEKVELAVDFLRATLGGPHESAVALWVSMSDAVLAYLEHDRVLRVLFRHRRRIRTLRVANGYRDRQRQTWELIADHMRDSGLLQGDDELVRLRIELLWLQLGELLDRAFRDSEEADPNVRLLLREIVEVQAALL